ncbi:rCG33041, isoform CRA_c [Rattus norvegicus]|uniref:RCG33041, isoform CRA_c n=1 Tax=Rattus norvegicus TaxID=10116 RepID=A6HJ24_RAT|nr:rCG33041, isoform CRA_c [Rattus norvegicus]
MSDQKFLGTPLTQSPALEECHHLNSPGD